MTFTDEDVSRILNYSGRKRGRRRKALSERKYATSITLSPRHSDYALAQAAKAGYTENLSAGIGACIERCIAQERDALAAIQAAAERRDQTTVEQSLDRKDMDTW